MTDDTKPIGETEGAAENESKLYTEEELQRIVRKRLKNHITQNEELQRQVQSLQAPAPPPVPGEEAPEAAPPVMPQPNGNAPSAGLTEDGMRNIMEDSRQKALEANQVQKASDFHNQNIQRMRTEDPEFTKLSSQENALGIPANVAIHLSNALNHEQAKKVFKELLSNETANLRMQNAALSGKYDDWLQKLLTNAMPSEGETTPPRTTPDLSREQSASTNDQADDVLMDYIKNA